MSRTESCEASERRLLDGELWFREVIEVAVFASLKKLHPVRTHIHPGNQGIDNQTQTLG